MENNKKYGIYKTIMIVGLTAFITFLITSISLYTYYTKNSLISYKTNTDQTENIAKLLTQYRKVIDKYFLGEIDEQKLKEGAIKGYIEGLGDPYTEYISKEDLEDYLDDTMGNFVGIGIYMIQNTNYDRIQVLSVIKDSPAERAGIQAGDIIMTVEGVTYTADQMTTASNNIKGEEGTTVSVEILRSEEHTSELQSRT